MKKVLLNPNDANLLLSSYENAATNSVELLIATAFLTEWPIKTKLNKNCKSILVLIGTDFRLTRKNAMHSLLKWTPPDKRSNVLAVPSSTDSSFHPKIIVWKEKNGKCYSLIGSSNLTSAAFKKNHEVNALHEITKNEFLEIKNWLRNIALYSQVITSDWINDYKESIISKSGTSAKKPENVKSLEIKILKKHKKKILERRAQQKSFKEIKSDLTDLINKSAKGDINNSTFWSEFWELWANHHSRFQGSGIQFSGKNANWKQASVSLLKILNGPKDIFDLDNMVQMEIDYLKNKENPMRGAWLSEMLCHFYPTQYPVLNSPVKKWLKIIKWCAERGSTEGSKYVELARKLRFTMGKNKEIKSLAELDNVIWQIVDDKEKKHNK